MKNATWILLVLAPVLGLAAIGCGDDDDGAASDADTDADSDADSDADTDADSDADSDADGDTDTMLDEITDQVEIETSMGSFTVGLFGEAGPITVTNFLSYVDSGFYEQTIFHRVIPGFMIQGGGMDEAMSTLPTDPPIALEIIPWLSHQPGVISMARTSAPDSATSQFFVCVDDNTSLDGSYAAFGIVLEGYDVVEAISEVETHSVGMYDDVPVTPITIDAATLL